jgi:hypothetical protein
LPMARSQIERAIAGVKKSDLHRLQSILRQIADNVDRPRQV